jgi:hypothetical protein
MIVEYRTPRPASALQRSERRAWIGFAIWIPAMMLVAVVLGALFNWMRSHG